MTEVLWPSHLMPDVRGKRVLVRVDYNVPMDKGVPTSTWRIDATLPWIRQLLQHGAAVTLISHLGRPTEGVFSQAHSLAPLRAILSQKLGQPVAWHDAWPQDKPVLAPGHIALAENVRFLSGEKAASPALAAKMAEGYDVLILDAFATAHRCHASNFALVDAFDAVYLGPLFQQELHAIRSRTQTPGKPSVALIGGAKVTTKFDLMAQLAQSFDVILLGGGLANTFLQAKGVDIGASLFEPASMAQAKQWLSSQTSACAQWILPEDMVVQDAEGIRVAKHGEVGAGRILDIGPKTIARYRSILQSAQTIIWNGPMGLFEMPEFAVGSLAMAEAVAQCQAQKLLGGGDTLAVIEQSGLPKNCFGHQSTGGGAFLAALLPDGIPVLDKLPRDVYER